MRHALAFALCLLTTPAQADGLRRLDTGAASRGWEAVGRLDLDGQGFCTGVLVAPQQVLTAAHCLWDRQRSRRITPERIEFRAGWRNGRAAAYRRVRRAVVHPEHMLGSDESLSQVQYDLALLELESPIRLPAVRPYEMAPTPGAGTAVEVVSYAHDRAEAPSLQEACLVLTRHPGAVVLSCDIDFGSSGAPVFRAIDGVPRVVSIITAKAEMAGEKVALASDMGDALAIMRALLGTPPATGLPQIGTDDRADKTGGGVRFLRPPTGSTPAE